MVSAISGLEGFKLSKNVFCLGNLEECWGFYYIWNQNLYIQLDVQQIFLQDFKNINIFFCMWISYWRLLKDSSKHNQYIQFASLQQCFLMSILMYFFPAVKIFRLNGMSKTYFTSSIPIIKTTQFLAVIFFFPYLFAVVGYV